MFLLFYLFKRQKWAQTFYFFHPLGVYRMRWKMHVLVNFLHEFIEISLIGQFQCIHVDP